MAHNFLIEDFLKDTEGNLRDTIDPIFGSLDISNLPPDQKDTAVKVFDQMRSTWIKSFVGENKRFVMNLYTKRSRSEDLDTKFSPILQRNRTDDRRQ